MKKVNFWKTLFLSALAVTAFTGCSNDDSENDGGMPSITVNGESTATGAVDLTGGTLTFEVVSSSDWTLAYDDTSAMSWCHVATAGKGGTTSLEVTVDAWSDAQGNAERTAKFTLTTYGNLAGVGAIPAKATITVKQNGTGSTEVTTNVKEVRAALAFDGQAVAASTVVTGIVVSDYVGNNINNHQIMITDNTTESGAGLLIRFKGYIGNKDTDYNLTKGMIVSLDLQGGIAQRYNDIQYQVDFTNATDPQISIEDSGDNTPEPITVTDLSKLVDYQSQYVQIYSQPVESIRGEKYYNVDSGYANQTFQTKDGATFQLSFMSYTSSWASTVEIPANAGYIKGCVSFNVQTPTLSPRNADDLTGMTEALFTVESKTATIGQITGKGEYEVANAKVVGVSAKGFVMQDATGVFYVHMAGVEESIPAMGNTVTVKGTVDLYGSNLQFSSPAVTVTDSGTDYELPSPTEVTADNVESIAAGKPQYVKLTCELAKSGNYYNFTFLFTSNYTGSLCYPEASLADPFDKKTIDVEGWYVYTVNSKYFYVLANSIKENSAVASGSFTKQPATFEATDPQAQELTFEANAAAGNVKFSITGTNADMFSYNYTSGNTVTVSAKGNNTTSAAYTAKLNLLSATDAVLASVDLKQNGVSSGTDTKGTYESMAGMVPTSTDSDNAAYAETAIINGGSEVAILKLGTGKKNGVFTTSALGVSGNKKLSFYAAAWNGKKATIYVRVNNGGSVSPASIEPISNSGVANTAPYKITFDDNTDYYTFELTNITEGSTLTFSTSANFDASSNSSSGRALLAGIQIY